jgi:hypothetical protein
VKQFIIVLTLFLVTFLAKAQDSLAYLKYKEDKHFKAGYIIDLDSTQIKGLIREEGNNKSINFVNTSGGEKKYKASEIKYYMITREDSYGVSEMKYISDGREFLFVLQEGKEVGLYKKVIVSASSTDSYKSRDALFVKKANEKLFTICLPGNFYKRFSDYFSDCAELKSKILKEELNFQDLDEIIYMYNYKCP